MSTRGKSSQHIAEALRQDICLSPAEADGMLHEGSLAQRFNVSRTPIRQALQRLAYERMITVKSGVGSVITPLEEDQRADDLHAACALIEAVAACAPDAPASMDHLREFAGMSGVAEFGELSRPEEFFDLRARLLEALAALIENPILEDAFRAAYWRLIRWRLRDLAEDPAPQVAHLQQLLRATAKQLKDGTVTEAFARLAALERQTDAALVAAS